MTITVQLGTVPFPGSLSQGNKGGVAIRFQFHNTILAHCWWGGSGPSGWVHSLQHLGDGQSLPAGPAETPGPLSCPTCCEGPGPGQSREEAERRPLGASSGPSPPARCCLLTPTPLPPQKLCWSDRVPRPPTPAPHGLHPGGTPEATPLCPPQAGTGGSLLHCSDRNCGRCGGGWEWGVG